MKISVIVPTYRRPQDLKRCLEALIEQVRSPDETIVVVRDTDTETWTFLENFDCDSLVLKIAKVTVPGVVAAMNLGLEQSTGDILAFTDDDAAPHPDWLEKIKQHFLQDETIAGVGGRDLQYNGEQPLDARKKVVGKLQWFGRVIGNHHIGEGEVREVDVLKGVNMSFRRTAIRQMQFDERMKGTGAQVHFELAFCLRLKSAGWKLLYNPEVLVDHYPAKRFDEDQRKSFNSTAFINSVYNETLAILEYFSPIQCIVFLFWSNLIGTRGNFGIIQLLRFLPQQKSLAIKKWQASLQGKWDALLTWQQSKYIRSTLVNN